MTNNTCTAIMSYDRILFCKINMAGYVNKLSMSSCPTHDPCTQLKYVQMCAKLNPSHTDGRAKPAGGKHRFGFEFVPKINCSSWVHCSVHRIHWAVAHQTYQSGPLAGPPRAFLRPILSWPTIISITIKIYGLAM